MNKCVYVHLVNETPIYVGSGSIVRPYAKQRRSPKHFSMFSDPTFRVVVVEDNLTTNDAKHLEFEIIQICKKLNFQLLNKSKSTCHTIKLTKDFVETHVKYDEKSPTQLVWSTDRYRKGFLFRKAGSTAGRINNTNKYNNLSIFNKDYSIHRLVWVLHHGEIPDDMVIDHIDGNKTNNLISNLRCVTQSKNCKTARKQKKSNTGFQGISENKNAYIVRWTEDLYNPSSKTFRFNPKINDKNTAFELALNFRNELVAQGKIELIEREPVI